MNGYNLTAAMRKARRKFGLSSTAQALFYEIIAIANEEEWADEFQCSNGELLSALQISEKTLINARLELVEAKLIYFNSGQGRRCFCDYSLKGVQKSWRNTGGNAGVKAVENTVVNTGNFPAIPPDYIKTETKTETKTNSIHSFNPREGKIEEQVLIITEQPQKIEKEKSCAQKEKEAVPTADDADSYFRKNHTSLYDLISKDNPQARTPDLRLEMLNRFWAENIDEFEKRLPAYIDIIKHFRNWVPKYSQVKKVQNQLTVIHGKKPTDNIIAERNASANASLERLAQKYGSGYGG